MGSHHIFACGLRGRILPFFVLYQVMEEFLKPWRERGWSMPERESLVWRHPNVRRAVDLCIEHLDWQPSYALAQFTPLLAFWVIRQRANDLDLDDSPSEKWLEEMRPIR